MKVGFVSLGCPKNRVDPEVMLGCLKDAGYTITGDAGEAEIIIVNTCGFITPAKQESVDAILEMAEYKTRGKCKKLIVAGCLSQRYPLELKEEIPEADAFIGVGDYPYIVDIIGGKGTGAFKKPRMCNLMPRVLTTPPYTAYVKIAEGCDNRCSYCAIPGIRGPFQSAEMSDVLDEMERLAKGGVKEIIVVAQDTTRYGLDNYGKYKLPELLRNAEEINGIEWIRLMYSYPESITDELLSVMASGEKICKYMDMPVQHGDDAVLHAMKRRSGSYEIREAVKRIRGISPDFIIRTSFIVGFPGETEEHFENLMRFADELEFDRAGVFEYSREEGTPAYDMEDQVPDEVKADRYDRLMRLQKDISKRRGAMRVGSECVVLIEGHLNGSMYVGRSYGEAPEIDGKVFVESARGINAGELVRVKISCASDYDLTGEILP